jgi:hypothetical protein
LLIDTKAETGPTGPVEMATYKLAIPRRFMMLPKNPHKNRSTLNPNTILS